MKALVLGGGPAGLYSSILLKKAFPTASITVLERNRPDDTFGWGVVFSDETLSNFADADRATHDEIQASFKYWREIHTFVDNHRTVSTGHGFSALSRKTLLLILQRRAQELGVELQFEREVESLDECQGFDLVIAADGVNSFVREQLSDAFQPTLDWRRCKFSWLGTTKPLEAFTFIFRENEAGLFQVHAYPFEDGLATWIVECREEVWQKAGLDQATEEDTVAYCQELFREDLDGHPLLSNRSLWRSFPTVRCERWVSDQTVLIGDAAHTAHFSIGSGTKIAMEDAVALVRALQEADAQQVPGTLDVSAALRAYEEGRRVDILKLQKAAQTSLEWFENSARYRSQDPTQFTFNLMTRSKRITYDNLAERDPVLVDNTRRWFARHNGYPEDRYAAPIFVPFRARELELRNRIVVSPMCQYSAEDGLVSDWHLVHLGSRAVGGAGLVMTEMTNVSAEGRITPGCAGMYREEHCRAWKKIVDFVHAHSEAKIGIQLAHAGRKGSAHHPWDLQADRPLRADEGAWKSLAPSALAWAEGWPTPREMDRSDMDRTVADFAQAAIWSLEAGFDTLELHMAHGYLLSSFLSPLTNRRRDDYGGSLPNRLRFPMEVLASVRSVWPRDRPIFVRLSATDWMPDGTGTTPSEAVEIARALHSEGCDVVDVSSAGNVPDSPVGYGRMYQVPFAEKIRYEAEVPVAAVGALRGADHANTVLAAGRADLTVMARPHLRNPYLALHAAEQYGELGLRWPAPYLAVQPKE